MNNMSFQHKNKLEIHWSGDELNPPGMYSTNKLAQVCSTCWGSFKKMWIKNNKDTDATIRWYKAKKIVRNCRYCKKQFVIGKKYASNKIFCNDKCRYQYNLKLAERWLLPLNGWNHCSVCGQMMPVIGCLGHTIARKNCSKECAVIARQRTIAAKRVVREVNKEPAIDYTHQGEWANLGSSITPSEERRKLAAIPSPTIFEEKYCAGSVNDCTGYVELHVNKTLGR